ncbi:MAG: flagellar protein FliS [Sphingopyxis sp.]
MPNHAAACAEACATYARIDLAARIHGASGHALVSILYEELDKVLGAISHAIRHNLMTLLTTHKTQFLMILHSLESGLNFDRGGAVALALARAYGTIRRDVMLGIDAVDIAQIAVAHQAAKDIASAWASIQDG